MLKTSFFSSVVALECRLTWPAWHLPISFPGQSLDVIFVSLSIPRRRLEHGAFGSISTEEKILSFACFKNHALIMCRPAGPGARSPHPCHRADAGCSHAASAERQPHACYRAWPRCPALPARLPRAAPVPLAPLPHVHVALLLAASPTLLPCRATAAHVNAPPASSSLSSLC